jgi:hypothetical protein
LAQSRCTVRSETPRIAAISAKPSPQKNFRSTSSASAASDCASASSASDSGCQVELAAALEGTALAHVVDDQPAHRPCGVGEETRLVGEGHAAAAEVEVGLVQQRGGAEREPRGIGKQLLARQPVQLAVQRGEQHRRGGGITALRGGDRVTKRLQVLVVGHARIVRFAPP